MKKLIVRLLIALLVVIILVLVGIGLFLDSAIKRGVETFGPKLTKVDIKLDSVRLSFLSGSGSIKGLLVGNPAGFSTPSAISVGSASLAIKPSSLLSDKIIIKSINVQAPEITYETTLRRSNLSTILDNVQQATGGGQKEPSKPGQPSQPAQAKPQKKLQVDDFTITGGKVHVSITGLGGQSATVPLPDIHLENLGTGPEGITAAELTQRVLAEIESQTVKAASGAVTSLGNVAGSATKNLGNAGSNALDSATRSIGGLFKKKQ
jgi:uncharacterized protein involved in outer membrane biogenesis